MHHLVISFGTAVVFLTLLKHADKTNFHSQQQPSGSEDYTHLPQHHDTVALLGSSVFSKLIVTVPAERGGGGRGALQISFISLDHIS